MTDERDIDLDFLWRWIMRLKTGQVTNTDDFLNVVWPYPGNPYTKEEENDENRP